MLINNQLHAKNEAVFLKSKDSAETLPQKLHHNKEPAL